MHHAITIAGKVLLVALVLSAWCIAELDLNCVLFAIHELATRESWSAIAWSSLEGALWGTMTILEFPTLLFPHSWLPRASSLILAPLVVGTLSHYLRKRDSAKFLFTFSGGCAFAFAFALIRVLLVNHH